MELKICSKLVLFSHFTQWMDHYLFILLITLPVKLQDQLLSFQIFFPVHAADD